jgi:HK97 family phage prohead protease
MRLVGYAATYEVNARRFRAPRPAYDGGLEVIRSTRALLFNHDVNHPIGYVKSIATDETGVLVSAVVVRSARRVRRMIRQGAIRGFSVGMVPLESTTEYDARLGEVTVIHRLLLFEVSVTASPADWRCTFRVQ